MSAPLPLQRGVSLRPFTTLRAGGPAEFFAEPTSVDELAAISEFAQTSGMPTTVLGWGSNVLPSDKGVPGLVIHNCAQRIKVALTGEVLADSGCAFQELFLKTAQANLQGLEFAVGIPGTLGGALVSNAGAYRSCVSDWVTQIEVVFEGKRQWVGPEWMAFSYRDSRLRQSPPPPAVILRVAMQLPKGDPKEIYQQAREFQRQRIGKQPAGPSAGSFFKNVTDPELAANLPGLTEGMRKAGVVPAGFLIEACGLKGFSIGGARLGVRHANFILNWAQASSWDIRRLAEFTKLSVAKQFGVQLEEEVLYLGNWTE